MITSPLARKRVIWFAITLLPSSFVVALIFGTVPFSLHDVLTVFLNSSVDDGINKASLIIEQIRLPRALLAALVGALLGICGATTQGLFRNPLADPSLIGVTAGASAGAAMVIFFGGDSISFFDNSMISSYLNIGLISIGAFVGGGLSVLLVYKLATNQHGTSVATMLLAGIAITAIVGGLTSLLEFFSDNERLRQISLWRMGGLDGASYQKVMIAGFFCTAILATLPRFSTALNALLLGESEARHLGLNVQKLKVQLVLLVAIGVGASVALAGTITFIGLVVPHIIRLLIGPDHRYLLPVSAVGGAILLLLADAVARTVLAPIELPVGLITAFLGAPFFISLLRHRHNTGLS